MAELVLGADEDIPPHELRDRPGGSQWYAARVQPQQELSVARRLEAFNAYAPCYVMDGKPWGPIFRSYVFCEFDMECDAWENINGDRAVVKLLPLHRAYPVAIGRSLIEECQRREANGEFLLRSRATLDYRRGDAVRVHYGPFEGKVGQFVRQRDSMVDLTMRIMGALRTMAFPVAQVLEPA